MTAPTTEPSTEPTAPRRLVMVVGSGRSGTSLMAGALRELGLHVPAPEVPADATNPRGFAESAWVVTLHEELLGRCNVAVADARPSAWFDAGRLGSFEPLRIRLTEWLEQQFAAGPELVVKDPRLAWFAGLWRGAALRCDAVPGYVTVLRPVTEVVGSAREAYGLRGDVRLTASWVNTMLHTERATRGSTRAFVRYADLLADWTQPVFALAHHLDLATVQEATANQQRGVHALVDPALHRVHTTWDDVDVPAPLREIARAGQEQLDRLVEPGGDGPEVHDALDELRAAYVALYDGAEALTRSSADAAHRAGLVAERPAPPRPARPRAAPTPPAPPATPRAADRLPHGVRALVPGRARRGLRRALGRSRGGPVA